MYSRSRRLSWRLNGLDLSYVSFVGAPKGFGRHDTIEKNLEGSGRALDKPEWLTNPPP